MLTLLGEARIYRPDLKARFLLNRCAARTILARETAETLADHDPPPLLTTIGQRIAFADVVQTGRLAAEKDDASHAARENTASAPEGTGLGQCESGPRNQALSPARPTRKAGTRRSEGRVVGQARDST